MGVNSSSTIPAEIVDAGNANDGDEMTSVSCNGGGIALETHDDKTEDEQPDELDAQQYFSAV